MHDETNAAEPIAAGLVIRRSGIATSLFWRGPLPQPGTLRVAVVGSRVATKEQLATAHALGRQLADAGVVVVSGGALGVDTAALRGALQASGQAVVAPLAVLPAAIDRPFPPTNAGLFDTILKAGGALCSLVAPGDAHSRGRFHARNDLLVQLVDAVIAVCADRPSGTLHCASRAWRQRVPVLAVPWSPETPCSAGVAALLVAGARVVWPGETLQDALNQLREAPEDLLRRAGEPPVQPARTRPAATNRQQTFDAAAAAWPCYARDAPADGLGRGDPAGCDASLLARLRVALAQAGGAGLTVEELAATTQTDRTVVATTVLQWTLSGGLKRVSGSWYVLAPGLR